MAPPEKVRSTGLLLYSACGGVISAICLASGTGGSWQRERKKRRKKKYFLSALRFSAPYAAEAVLPSYLRPRREMLASRQNLFDRPRQAQANTGK